LSQHRRRLPIAQALTYRTGVDTEKKSLL